jgi:2-dehydro-3-deoxyphosphogluconate aldolase/(4S)-4-hydroxy-2-oxoglutarate aldolase
LTVGERDDAWVDETRLTSGTTDNHRQGDLPWVLAHTAMVPVLTVESVESAIPLATALVAGGLSVLEITLRTETALVAIEAIGREVEGAIVGAGTVLSGEQLADVERAGARFAVSPGAAPDLLDAAENSPVPLLPGGTTPSEVMALSARGYDVLKFFPAEPAGGVAYLKALAGPFPEIRFCPTGGISAANAQDYLALETVICVGGSWVAPAETVAAGDWERVTALAKSAAGLSKMRASQ